MAMASLQFCDTDRCCAPRTNNQRFASPSTEILPAPKPSSRMPISGDRIGPVPVKQGDAREALAKYDEALKYAPTWKELREVHEAAAK
jgi:hypothetical protein